MILPDCAASSDDALCSSFSSSRGEGRVSQREKSGFTDSRETQGLDRGERKSRIEGKGTDWLLLVCWRRVVILVHQTESDSRGRDRTAAQLFPLLMHMEFDQNAVGNVK